MKKSIFVFFLILCIILSCACGSAANVGGAGEGDDAASEQTANESLEESVYGSFAGEYNDTFAGKAIMTIVDNFENAEVIVNWSNGSDEAYLWTMTAVLSDDGTKLEYDNESNCIIHFSADADEQRETVYEGESGYFEIEDGMLLWTGAFDETVRSCTFEKI